MVWFFGKKKEKEEKEKSEPSDLGHDAEATIKKYKVRYERKKCIGSAVCEAVATAYWKVENGKAVLLGSKLVDDQVYEKDITEKELSENKMAADGCPPGCIRVIDEQGKEIAPKR